MIEVEALRKTFRGGRGLNGFSLRVESNELVGLVGPNGAGKTTLIKILATLVAASSGTVRVNGHDVAGDPRAIRAVVGYLPDVPGVYQDMRVGEFLEFFADAFRLKEPRRGGDSAGPRTFGAAKSDGGLCRTALARMEAAAVGRQNSFASAKGSSARRTRHGTRSAGSHRFARAAQAFAFGRRGHSDLFAYPERPGRHLHARGVHR